MKLRQYKEIVYEWSGLVFIFLALFLYAISPNGRHLTQVFFDGIRITPERQEVAIVGIDDASLQALGAWPWNRSVFAELTKKLDEYGVKAVAYDVLFLEQREGDAQFRDVLSKVHTRVIFGSKLERTTYSESFFVDKNNEHLSSALANVLPDVDGKVRALPKPFLDGVSCVYGLGEQAFRVATFKADDTGCGQADSVYFRYPEHITKYSVQDILSGTISPELLKGKIVFVGSTALDLEDHFVGMNGEKIPGVEVHASIFTSLMNHEGDKNLPIALIFCLLLIITVLVLLVLTYIRTSIAQSVTFLFLLFVLFVVSYISFSFHTILPLPWMLFVMFFTLGYGVLVRFLKAKKRSEYVESLFSKYVHKDVLKELMKSGNVLTLTGEKRYLTVLFSDLRGFTTLSERISPEDLTSVLNGYFSAMTPIILDEHGTVDKFIGDAIMAFWNAPLRVDRHEERAVHAALSMQEAIVKFNQENNYTLSAGIGIHAGDAVVGNVGSKERVNYTILGDTVNLASRVEGLTKKYGVKILVTEEVMNKVKDAKVLFRKLDRITVKGKAEPTVLYEVMKRSEEKEDLVEDYAIAFNLYQKGDFEEALVLFRELAKKGDIPSQVMYERIADLEKTDTWDGVWHFEEK